MRGGLEEGGVKEGRKGGEGRGGEKSVEGGDEVAGFQWSGCRCVDVSMVDIDDEGSRLSIGVDEHGERD